MENYGPNNGKEKLNRFSFFSGDWRHPPIANKTLLAWRARNQEQQRWRWISGMMTPPCPRIVLMIRRRKKPALVGVCVAYSIILAIIWHRANSFSTTFCQQKTKLLLDSQLVIRTSIRSVLLRSFACEMCFVRTLQSHHFWCLCVPSLGILF